MALLAPLFLLGVLAIGLPIWLHRLQTQSPERRRFSSTMLLEQSQQQVHLKKKLRYLLLLALRIALLVLLALTFAKPVWERETAVTMAPGSILHLIVVDTSYSMQYEGWFDLAQQQANQIITAMADGDVAQIISASNNVEVKTEPSALRADLVATIDALQAGTGHLDLGAMMSGVNNLIRDYKQNIIIHLISDFQSSGLPSRFADLVPESRSNHLTELQLYPVSGETIRNLYVDTITRTPHGLDVGIRGNHIDPTDIEVALNINGVQSGQQTVSVEAGGQASLSFTVDKYEEGDNRVAAVMQQDDGLIADNTRYAVVDNTPPRPVLLLTNDVQALPVTYLRAALEAGQQGYRVEPVNINEFDARILQRYPWIIIDDIGIVSGGLLTSLMEYLQGGGAILAASGERAIAQSSLPLLNYAVRQTNLTAAGTQPSAVTGVDASHPVLAATSGWRDVAVSRYLDLVTDAEAHTMVSLDNGAPLLLERRFNQGRLLLFTSSLDNRWNDIPIRPVFVNFLAEAARYLSGRDQLKRNQIAGDYMQLLRSGSAAGQVVAPDGRTVLSLADTHRSQQIRMDLTGFYEIYTADSEQLIAVNADLRESDLAVMPAADIQRWKDAVEGSTAASDGAGEIKIQQEPVQLWHILLILFGIVVLVESLLGNTYLGAGRGSV